ncbi:MAG TPA: prevent-host-death protein [Nitrospira sp.]|nr:prevent-host-death protein [Nitrospira sp.]
MPDQTIVASTEFQTRAGLYIERAAKNPVFITKHSRPVRVLLDIEEYNRLKARDTRKAYYAHELPDEVVEALKNSDLSHIDPKLDLLMD